MTVIAPRTSLVTRGRSTPDRDHGAVPRRGSLPGSFGLRLRSVTTGASPARPPPVAAQLVDRWRPGCGLEVLTPREREVLALLAEGLTNRGIEARLVVSGGTVHSHLRHIFAKLELPSGEMEHRRVHAVLTYLRS